MRLKIISEGRGATTKIINEKTGEVLINARSVTWTVDARGLAHATIELINVAIDAVVDEKSVEYIYPVVVK